MTQTIIRQITTRAHDAISKSTFLVSCAIKLRNQVNAIIRSRMRDGIALGANGEEWLIKETAADVRVFVDVGANAGLWTRALLSKSSANFTKGFLFEPAPSAVAMLRLEFEDEIQRGNIEILPIAVSDISGVIPFYTDDMAGETASLIRRHADVNSKEISVSVSTLDSCLTERNVEYVDLLKIDAEGHDAHVIKGAGNFLRGKKIGVIQFEYNRPWLDAGSTLRELIDFLNSFGYEVFLLKNEGLLLFPYEIYGDFFGYANFVAVSPDLISKFGPITRRI